MLISGRTLVLLLVDALLASLAMGAAAEILTPSGSILYLEYERGFEQLGIVVAIMLMALYFQDLYAEPKSLSRLVLFQQLSTAFGVSLLAQAVVAYALPDLAAPRSVLVLGSLLTFGALFSWRLAFARISAADFVSEAVLFVGEHPLLDKVIEAVEESPGRGYRVAKRVATLTDPALTPGQKLRELVTACKPDRIVVCSMERRGTLPMQELLQLRLGGVRIEQLSTIYERIFRRTALETLRPSDLIYSELLGPSAGRLRAQEIYSFVFAVLLLLVAWPVMLLTALVIRLTSKGPILYRQVRVGKDNRHFTIYKFRSMRVDAEAKTGAVWAGKDDPRITRFGKFMRKTRLDELPQLFNVVRGEMAFCGPRPERPEFTQSLEKIIPFFGLRTAVKPGITGWAQINHKYGDTLEDTKIKLEYDLFYIKNLSMTMDLLIAFQTVKTVILRRGSQ